MIKPPSLLLAGLAFCATTLNDHHHLSAKHWPGILILVNPSYVLSVVYFNGIILILATGLMPQVHRRCIRERGSSAAAKPAYGAGVAFQRASLRNA